jgi:hypothetical protein
MKPGTLVKINGQLDDDTYENWYGEVVGTDVNGELEVFLLERSKSHSGYIWEYHGDWQTVPKESVLETYSPDIGIIQAYKAMGFYPTVNENQFICLSDDIPEDLVLPLQLDEPDEQDQYVEDGFVTMDESECFTFAPVESDFVKETHKAVNDFNNWTPDNPAEIKAKEYIDYLATKVAGVDDNKQFARGHSLNYTRPPV